MTSISAGLLKILLQAAQNNLRSEARAFARIEDRESKIAIFYPLFSILNDQCDGLGAI
jgi:hypothetical protein